MERGIKESDTYGVALESLVELLEVGLLVGKDLCKCNFSLLSGIGADPPEDKPDDPIDDPTDDPTDEPTDEPTEKPTTPAEGDELPNDEPEELGFFARI